MAKAKKKKPARKKPAAKKLAKPAKKILKKVAKKKPAPRAAAPKRKVSRPSGVPEQLRDAALKILDERQAEEVITVELAGRSSVADYLIIASGRAGRQIAAIAQYLREAFEQAGARQTRIEGLPEANWVLVDAGDVIVHLFRPEVRRYYRLDEIWTGRDSDMEKSALLIE